MSRPNWDEYPCILWKGGMHGEGYGKLPDGRLAHRVAFEEHYGYLPEEPNVVDHQCRVRPCIQPYHLQDITRAENTRLGTDRNGPLTEECPKGHREWKIRKSGYRFCNRCHIDRETERNRRKRADRRKALVA